jgi:hypothetical protein
MRPLIGAGTVVCLRLMRAVSRAAAFGEGLVAIGLDRRRALAGAGALQVGLGLVRRRAVETRVDLIERLSRADIGALGEQPPLDQAGDLRAHLARLVGHGPSAQRDRQRHGARLRDVEADRRGRTLEVLVPARTGGERGQEHKQTTTADGRRPAGHCDKNLRDCSDGQPFRQQGRSRKNDFVRCDNF